MDILIKSVTIVDPNGPHHGTTKDVHVKSGVIAAIDESIAASSTDEVWEETGACLSLGWMDLQADFADPGFEQKEGLQNGLKAAKALREALIHKCT